jgi:hypothetical protein
MNRLTAITRIMLMTARQIGPCADDLHVRLVDEPPVAGSMAAGPHSLDELRGEPLQPTGNGDIIYGDATLSEQRRIF